MTTVKSWFLLICTWTLPSIYQLGSDLVKKLFRNPIQKGGKVLLWNQVKSRMEACYSELILVRLDFFQNSEFLTNSARVGNFLMTSFDNKFV